MKKKPKKIKIKKLFKNSGSMAEGFRHLEALMENMQDNFRVFGESLEMTRQELKRDILVVKEKTDATFEEVGRIKIEMSEFKEEMSEFKEETNVQLADIKQELKSIKNEIDELKQTLQQKAGLGRLLNLEQRVFNIEKHLKLSRL